MSSPMTHHNQSDLSKDRKSDASEMVQLQHANTCNSAILRIPAELRLYIYEHVFDSEVIHWRACKQRGVRLSPPDPLRPVSSARHTIALRYVCHQIHAETKDLPLKHCTFEFDHYSYVFDVQKTFATAQLGLITKIIFRIDTKRSHYQPVLGLRRLTYDPNGIYSILPSLRSVEVIVDYSPPVARQTEAELQSHNQVKRLIKGDAMDGWRRLLASNDQAKVHVEMLDSSLPID